MFYVASNAYQHMKSVWMCSSECGIHQRLPWNVINITWQCWSDGPHIIDDDLRCIVLHGFVLKFYILLPAIVLCSFISWSGWAGWTHTVVNAAVIWSSIHSSVSWAEQTTFCGELCAGFLCKAEPFLSTQWVLCISSHAIVGSVMEPHSRHTIVALSWTWLSCIGHRKYDGSLHCHRNLTLYCF